MRNRQTHLNTEDETLTADFWQAKWQEMQTSMADLREENLILHKVVHEAAQNQMSLQNQVSDLQQNLKINPSSAHVTNSAASLPADGTTMANLNQLSVDRIQEALKGHQSPLDRNPYQPTTEQIEDDWTRKNN